MGFAQELRENVFQIWEANFNHPFVQGIGKGTFPREKFVFCLEPDYLYLIEFFSYLALVASRVGNLTSEQAGADACLRKY